MSAISAAPRRVGFNPTGTKPSNAAATSKAEVLRLLAAQAPATVAGNKPAQIRAPQPSAPEPQDRSIKGQLNTLKQHLLFGTSHMIPFIVAGGVLLSLSVMMSGKGAVPEAGVAALHAQALHGLGDGLGQQRGGLGALARHAARLRHVGGGSFLFGSLQCAQIGRGVQPGVQPTRRDATRRLGRFAQRPERAAQREVLFNQHRTQGHRSEARVVVEGVVREADDRIRERLAESNRAATDAATAEGGSAFLPVLADRRRGADDQRADDAGQQCQREPGRALRERGEYEVGGREAGTADRSHLASGSTGRPEVSAMRAHCLRASAFTDSGSGTYSSSLAILLPPA